MNALVSRDAATGEFQPNKLDGRALIAAEASFLAPAFRRQSPRIGDGEMEATTLAKTMGGGRGKRSAMIAERSRRSAIFHVWGRLDVGGAATIEESLALRKQLQAVEDRLLAGRNRHVTIRGIAGRFTWVVRGAGRESAKDVVVDGIHDVERMIASQEDDNLVVMTQYGTFTWRRTR